MFNKNGSLNRKTILQFKHVGLRKFLVGRKIKDLAEILKTKTGFHKVRANFESDEKTTTILTIGKKGKELAIISYTAVSGTVYAYRNAMREADMLNKIIAQALTPVIPQDANHCPKCGNENVFWDRLETDGDSASQGGFCNRCNCQWSSVFKFTHNEILD